MLHLILGQPDVIPLWQPADTLTDCFDDQDLTLHWILFVDEIQMSNNAFCLDVEPQAPVEDLVNHGLCPLTRVRSVSVSQGRRSTWQAREAVI